ncbi:inner membrane protein [Panacagrimonas perspica]|uniref:Inner membrane protein n=1 Tax=Panacagrimonas perspica TaxID=381431 RepID=A0A4R7P310_9GAMM|nr:cell envelope integrity protein CreD [Panacagrimonas perspica]TDU28133.1 inner membrane protein [Panacagrimonas perspica]THD00632.1 cell envelope integrity protein CreD [Panacagrimonas perspica]
MTTTDIPSRMGQLMNKPGPRLAGIGLLILLLLIPLGMIESKVSERGQRRDEAAADVARSWGRAQSLAGPILRLPYTIRWREKDEERNRTGWLVLPPQKLDVVARLDTEVRKRGIFEVPVYRANLKLRGQFKLPEPSDLGVVFGDIDFGRAEVMIGIAEPGALSADSRVQVDGQVLVLEPSAQSLGTQGVHVLMRQGVAAEKLAQGVAFEVDLNLNGSSAFHLAPVARETTLSIASNWPHPSFGGNGLPRESEISGEGFKAAWSVSHLGRGYPPVWLDTEVTREQIDAAAFGVELCVPVDPYRMAERIAKYGVLVLLLSFAAIWVMELLGGRPLHPVQYLLLGGSLCLFGLLQLSLAEHLGFAVAFVLAAGAVVLQASWYARVATRSTRRAFALGALLSAWFGYLYVVLQAEDMAFLLGALALFAVLTAVMWATRKVNWSSSGNWDVADATLE